MAHRGTVSRLEVHNGCGMGLLDLGTIWTGAHSSAGQELGPASSNNVGMAADGGGTISNSPSMDPTQGLVDSGTIKNGTNEGIDSGPRHDATIMWTWFSRLTGIGLCSGSTGNTLVQGLALSLGVGLGSSNGTHAGVNQGLVGPGGCSVQPWWLGQLAVTCAVVDLLDVARGMTGVTE